MSRAFVSDDTSDSRADEAPEIKIPIPPGSRNYVTPEGGIALANELRSLELQERPRVQAELDRAAASGAEEDVLSSLRKTKAKLERRIEYLSRMAAMTDVVPEPAGGYDTVRFGARVRVLEASDQVREYRIVGVDEADPERGLIGWTSPIARALMGKAPKDLAKARLPDREIVLEIVSLVQEQKP